MPRIASGLMAATLALLPTLLAAQDILLTVTGGAETRQYDRADLEALGDTEFTSTTIWTEGEQTFTGVPLSVILQDAGVPADTTGGTLRATAVNDYGVDIPLDEVIAADWPIVAYALNGEEMSLRDKGPLWIVYPFDSDPEFRSEVVYSRSVWQLDRLGIEY